MDFCINQLIIYFWRRTYTIQGFCFLQALIWSQKASAFLHHLGLTDTHGLNLMWVSRLSTVWITWEDKVHVVESEAVDQTKWVTPNQSCEPLYDVQKFNYTIGFITQKQKSIPDLYWTHFFNPWLILVNLLMMFHSSIFLSFCLHVCL